MTRAYSEAYLDDAMKNLGEAFDYAANACNLSLDGFAELFSASGYAEKFGTGNPKIVSGMSGTELAMQVLSSTGKSMVFPEPQEEYEYSPEYWCGWILAYYQWSTSRPFRDIFEYVSMSEIYKLYPTLHEASEEKFVDTLNAIIGRKKHVTKLQAQRKICGYSQRELSERAGVNLRTLQQYELGAKDINRASAMSVARLAAVLGCKTEDLLERE